jgi:hypothetical protein
MKKKFDISKKTPDEIQKFLSEAYMNIYIDDENQLYNPLVDIPPEFEENPEYFITNLMSQPEFFTFTCQHILGVNIVPFQAVILRELWNRRFPMLIGSRGMSKSFILAIYVILKLLFCQNRKIILCGASFRQSKVVFAYVESIVSNSTILRSMFKPESFAHANDAYVVTLGNSYCKALPIGTGEKIRGQRANDIVADEFSSMLIDIFETVIAGFAAVSSAPDKNVKNIAKQKLIERLRVELDKIGIEYEDAVDAHTGGSNNQIIIAGTAHYDFNHFSKYHKRWLQIIKTRNDKQKLKALFGEKYEDGLDARDYSVIRVPIDLVPDGFMDKAQINRSKATMSSSNYIMEFGAGFVSDSDGFFKNTLIRQCCVDYDMKLQLPSGRILEEDELFFEPELFGDLNAKYIYGIDPASQQDNFSIVILKLCNHGEYRKIVNVWVTNNKDHKEQVKEGQEKEHNFYAFCCRKIRKLMKTFTCERIALDSQGGGVAIMEGLKDKDKLEPGELPIYPIIVPGKPQDTDGEAGLHIIEIVNFSSQEWTSNSNHGMKKDLEDRILLFPFIDTVSIAIAQAEHEQYKIDDMQKLLFNIEELKLELVTITVSETPTGREHFDTPEIKTGTGRKGRMKKDRYSALLMANASARNLAGSVFSPITTFGGGFSSSYKKTNDEQENMFVGPSWITNQLQSLYD